MEENKKTTSQEEPFIKRYDTVFGFLGLELLALLTFGLGGITGLTFIKIIAFFVSLGVLPFIKAHHGELNFKMVLCCFIPVAALAVLLGFSRFWFSAYSSASPIFSVIVENLTVTLGIAGFFLLAYGLKRIPAVKKEYIVYALLGGLALYVLIATIYSLSRYGFFYAARFNHKNYYYDGILHPIYKETKALDGFSFKEVSLEFGCLPAFLLACSLPGLLSINPKIDSKKFAIIACFGGIGLLSLAFIPYVKGLIVLAGVYVLAVLIFLIRRAESKNEKVVSFLDKAWLPIVAGLTIVGVIGFAILAIDANINLAKPILKNQYFAEIENTIFKSFHENGGFSIKPLLFGQTLQEYSSLAEGSTAQLARNRNFLISVLGQNGIIAFLLLIAIIMGAVYKSRQFFKENDFFEGGKLIVSAMGIGLFVFLFFFYDETPYVHFSTTILPFTRSIYVFISLALIGLIYSPKGLVEKKEVAVNE